MIRHALWALALLTVVSCSKKPKVEQPGPSLPPPTGKPFTTAKGAVAGTVATAVIGAAGGQLQSTDGQVRIQVPAGAVAGDQNFSIQAVSNTLRPDRPLVAYRLLPENVTFTKPVNVTIAYEPSALTAGSEEMLMLAWQTADGTWRPLPTSLNKTAHTVTAPVTHFCDLAFYEQFELFAAKTEIRAGQEVALRCGVQEINLNQDSLLAPIEHKVDDATFGRTVVSNYSMIHDKYVTRATGWKVLSGPGTVTAQKNPFGIEGNAVYKAPATVTGVTTAIVEVTLEGLIGLKDPNSPNGIRKPEKLVLRQPIQLVPEAAATFMKIEIDGEVIMIAPQQAMFANYDNDLALFDVEAPNNFNCQVSLTNPKIGTWPCGPQNGAVTEAYVTLQKSTNDFMASMFCEEVGGQPVSKHSAGKLIISKVGNANEPIEGVFTGTLYKSRSVVGCDYETHSVKITFRFLRFV
ncbi:hypothetical protein [Chitinophaga deserti]|uniref:hypothetical protein n=1 Tax=Chitinophaga deserti TaxID=2164099 RepID=UPI000D6AEC79|nr:hypothetical protein [Chitinophaga deserti]